MNQKGANVTLHINDSKGSLLSKNRHNLVTAAIEAKADYILWIDSDIRFPPDLFFRLVQWGKDIVGCNYPQKKIPSHPTVFIDKEDAARLFPEEMEAVPTNKMVALISRPEQKGLIKCVFLGFGALLMRTECFKNVPPPWFDITWKPGTNDYEGEDVCCLRRMREFGFDVYCDLETSNLVTHIGDFEYTHDLVEGYYGSGNGNENHGSR